MESQVSSYGLGLIFIVLVSIIWAASSILVQYLYENQSFDSPFLLTYIGTSLFTILLPLDWLLQQYGKRSQSFPSEENERYALSEDHENADEVHRGHRKWTLQDHKDAAAKVAPVWFISNYAFNASLRYTSITSSTVLASTGSVFTFLFALLWRDEHFSVLKLLGVGLGMMGSILTGLHDVHGSSTRMRFLAADNDHGLWGDALALLSAVGYGVYAVMIRVFCPKDESLMSMQQFLGFIGLYNMVALSPIALWQSIRTAAISALVLASLIVKGLLDNVLSDYLWARAVVLTSATVASVGLGLTIPLAFLSDVIMGRPNIFDASSILGALSVLFGFVLVNVGQKRVDGDNEIETVVHAVDDEEEIQDVQTEQYQNTSSNYSDTEGALEIT